MRPLLTILAATLVLVGLSGCAGPAEPGTPSVHNRPIVEKDGRTLLWAGKTDDGEDEWFDMTGSLIDPSQFQFGIGRDTIASIDAPRFATFDDPRVAAGGITRQTFVLGVSIDGVARAYPEDIMSRHEVVNDEIAGKPYAVIW
ncbi:MAG: DUF3179 domain-containing protein [Planctomycetes bacterium]|nr:DUF3179 domain-containing protein [Planctomycetota bacterium]